jgi:hypothetical protein
VICTIERQIIYRKILARFKLTILKKILTIFSVAGKSSIHYKSKEVIEIKFHYLDNESETFVNENDYFIFQFIQGHEKIKWVDIERLIAYKADLMTVDEIRMDIIYNNQQITITEETPGWDQFVTKTKAAFPSIQKNWDFKIIQPPFATNLIVLYERVDRKMPEQNNFYAIFNNITKIRIKEVLEKHGWASRKASGADFELANSWSELILESDNSETFLNGMVAFHQDNIAFLDKIFNDLGVQYNYEFYDDQKNLILEKKTSE